MRTQVSRQCYGCLLARALRPCILLSSICLKISLLHRLAMFLCFICFTCIQNNQVHIASYAPHSCHRPLNHSGHGIWMLTCGWHYIPVLLTISIKHFVVVGLCLLGYVPQDGRDAASVHNRCLRALNMTGSLIMPSWWQRLHMHVALDVVKLNSSVAACICRRTAASAACDYGKSTAGLPSKYEPVEPGPPWSWWKIEFKVI